MSGASELQELHWLLDVIQSTDIGVLVVDAELTIAVFNRFMQAHSGKHADAVIGHSLLEVFPDSDAGWITRRIRSVFELGVPAYSTWEQRPYLFLFRLNMPLHFDVEFMYQNCTFVPLRSTNDVVEKVAIVIYDVTDSALSKRQLQQAQEQLLLLSRTDRLTGLNNRGYWDERLHQEFKRVRRSCESCSLVMFDIDHFKSINDRYGHQVGDAAICMVARTLLNSCREVDICGRYGGEEFVVLLPGTGVEGALVFCERLRKTIENSHLQCHGVDIQLTVSLGVAALSDGDDTPETWVCNADAALYQAKNSGRNRTAAYRA
ncbi:MAG: diguanylate cyclase [Spongiibacteraceae bacterium]|jgi:diguanylate cyclase (GGDEF)-like protein|nr:diguanylate cyclase [Spongiibacteraceae bacterium]